MATLQDYMRSLEFNGQSLDRGGTIDPTRGGYTVSNAPFIFARLLQQLSQPGGPLSELSSSRVLGGKVAGIASQAEAQRRQTGTNLANAGVNDAQAGSILAGVDTGVQRAISEARAAEQARLQDKQQEALTGLANVTAQSESTQKERAEQLRQFEIALKELKKNKKFNRLISIASLGVSAAGAGLFSGFGALFGAGSSGSTARTGSAGSSSGGNRNLQMYMDIHNPQSMPYGSTFPTTFGPS